MFIPGHHTDDMTDLLADEASPLHPVPLAVTEGYGAPADNTNSSKLSLFGCHALLPIGFDLSTTYKLDYTN